MSYRPNFIIDENVLTIYPSRPQIERWLTYKEKSLKPDGSGDFETSREEKAAYWVREYRPEGNVISTWQGLWKMLMVECLKKGWTPVLRDVRDPFPEPKLHLMHGFRFSQERLTKEMLTQGWSGILSAPTRWGKCLGRDTPVMMFDGSIRSVQDIVDGDLVMGPDSKPRLVTGCIRGHGPMYRVTPNFNGMSWTCNEDHILHVERTGESGRGGKTRKGRRENITVREWMASSKWFRHIRKQRRVSVEFPEQELKVPPYIYGAWLGDGHHSGVAFTSEDHVILEEIDEWAKKLGMVKSESIPAGAAVTQPWKMAAPRSSRNSNPTRAWFRARHKREGIRPEYLISSREQRLELLAGLIDTDGDINDGTNLGFISKYKKLAEDVAHLCNTLGLPATVRPRMKKAQTGPARQYWRVCIRGAVDDIPVRLQRKKPVRTNKFNGLLTGFEVEPIGDGDYFGFELEGSDRLFLLGDCTVTHNTFAIVNTIRAYPELKTVVIIPGEDLGKQLYDDLVAMLPGREVKLLGFGSSNKTQGKDVTVCSMDSMDKLDHSGTRLVLIDEVHALPTDGRLPEFSKFLKARKYGYGATQAGRFDNRDIITEGAIGPVLAEISYKEARAEGSVAPITVFMLRCPYDVDRLPRRRDQIYKEILWGNVDKAQLVAKICNEVIPQDWQTLAFITNEKAADHYHKHIGDSSIAMAKRMSSKERKAMMNAMQRAQVTRCVATKIYAQGVTFPDLRVCINLSGGGASTFAVQMVGRVAQVRKDIQKRCGVVIDFLFEGFGGAGGKVWGPTSESKARLALFEEKGYDVVVVNTLGQLKEEWAKRVV
jgi:hypothetical protein